MNNMILDDGGKVTRIIGGDLCELVETVTREQSTLFDCHICDTYCDLNEVLTVEKFVVVEGEDIGMGTEVEIESHQTCSHCGFEEHKIFNPES